MRSDDIFKRRQEARRKWNARFNTYKESLRVDIGRRMDGGMAGVRVSVDITPNKAHQDGSQGVVNKFIVDTQSDALYVGEAIRQMLVGDDTLEDPQLIPFFETLAQVER